ncbi:MAG TPA: NAD(P)H-dependent oxidoreductase [Fimbriimonadaceae bacterium]|jgi:multimeric flavodoxin WrbA
MSSLKAILINCTLKPQGEKSSTAALLSKVEAVLKSHHVDCKTIHAVDAKIHFGVEASMGKNDGWPAIHSQLLESDIIVIGCPIWLAKRSSVCQMVLERMDALLNETTTAGQLPLYNKVGGVCVVGNEDGAQNVAAGILYNLMQFGATIPPNAEAYWVGLAGGEDDYVDVGQDQEYTNQLVSYLGHNLVHVAKILRANPIPVEGNKAK